MENAGLEHFAVNSLINNLSRVVFGELDSFIQIAEVFIGILLAIELFKEAIRLAHGEGFQLSKKLITWVLVMILIGTAYPSLAQGVFDSARSLGKEAITKWGEALEKFYDGTLVEEPSFSILKVLSPKTMTMAVGYGVSMIVGLFCFFLVYVMLCGAYGCLALLLLVGPVAIAFMLNDDFRGIAIKWINSVINYLIMIPIYGVTMVIVASIFGASLNAIHNSLSGGSLAASIISLILAPMLALGIVHQGPKAVMSLIGGVGGGGETAAAMMGMIGGMAAKGVMAKTMTDTKAAAAGAYQDGGRWGGAGASEGGKSSDKPAGGAAAAGATPAAGGGNGGDSGSKASEGGEQGAPGAQGNDEKGAGKDSPSEDGKKNNEESTARKIGRIIKNGGSRVAPHVFKPVSTMRQKLDKVAEGAQPHHTWPNKPRGK